MVKSSTQRILDRRKQCTMQDDHLRARNAKKKRAEQLSLGHGEVMELELIKLKEF